MRLPAEEAPKSDINVTPLVDVMLVILIIFMLVTPLLQKGMTVALPAARNILAVPDDPGRTATVVLRASGETYLNDERIDPRSLTVLLAERRRRNPNLDLHLKADRSCSYGLIRQTLRASREAGFADAAFLAVPLDASAASPLAPDSPPRQQEE